MGEIGNFDDLENRRIVKKKTESMTTNSQIVKVNRQLETTLPNFVSLVFWFSLVNISVLINNKIDLTTIFDKLYLMSTKKFL